MLSEIENTNESENMIVKLLANTLPNHQLVTTNGSYAPNTNNSNQAFNGFSKVSVTSTNSFNRDAVYAENSATTAVSTDYSSSIRYADAVNPDAVYGEHSNVDFSPKTVKYKRVKKHRPKPKGFTALLMATWLCSDCQSYQPMVNRRCSFCRNPLWKSWFSALVFGTFAISCCLAVWVALTMKFPS